MKLGFKGLPIVVLAALAATPASAAMTVYEFEGAITSQIGGVDVDGLKGHVGDAFVGTVSFDPEKPYSDFSSATDYIGVIKIGDFLSIDTPNDKASSSLYNGVRNTYLPPFNPVIFSSQGGSYQCAGSGYVTTTGPSTMSFSLGCVAGNARFEGSGTYKAAGSGTGAVPEPATWLTMILGFGAVGYSMRRKTILRHV